MEDILMCSDTLINMNDYYNLGWFDRNNFLPIEQNCLIGDDTLLMNKFRSNLIIFLAYLTISSAALMYVVNKWGKLSTYSKLGFVLIFAFVFSCGMDHNFDWILIYKPYWYQSMISEFIVELVSVPAAIVLFWFFLKARSYPTIEEIIKMNRTFKVMSLRLKNILKTGDENILAKVADVYNDYEIVKDKESKLQTQVMSNEKQMRIMDNEIAGLKHQIKTLKNIRQ